MSSQDFVRSLPGTSAVTSNRGEGGIGWDPIMVFTLLLVIIPILFYLQARHMGMQRIKAELTRQQIASRSTLAGFFIGGYDGLFGPGTGTFLLLVFMLFLHMSTKEASANARIVNYASNVSAFIYFLYQGRIF